MSQLEPNRELNQLRDAICENVAKLTKGSKSPRKRFSVNRGAISPIVTAGRQELKLIPLGWAQMSPIEPNASQDSKRKRFSAQSRAQMSPIVNSQERSDFALAGRTCRQL
ncbi:hypothetical protein AVEN_40011-1 [Araneus ventricosus]|uniref:Uncharacterized protein n=1 Tax=Araneus ventricosus TaxID=182803 RepID=A0A4Y2FZP0_ARAVE|nr:hypothetical protein AVEN_40011-1 [Araneus ventricosus]